MSIVTIKNQIASILLTLFESQGQSVKVIRSNFNEDTDNKPQMSKQIAVKHTQTQTTLISSKDRSYLNAHTFEIDVTVKDLKTDDTIQIIVDLILNSLIGAKMGLFPIQELSADNQGWNDGIWKYVISLVVSEQSDNDDPEDNCTLHGVTDLDFVINLVPSYSKPLNR